MAQILAGKSLKGNAGLACVFLLAAAQLLTVKDPLQRVAKGTCSSRVGSWLEHLVVPYKDIPVTWPFATTMAHHFSGRNHARNMLEHLFIQSKEIRKSSTTTTKNNSSEILPWPLLLWLAYREYFSMIISSLWHKLCFHDWCRIPYSEASSCFCKETSKTISFARNKSACLSVHLFSATTSLSVFTLVLFLICLLQFLSLCLHFCFVPSSSVLCDKLLCCSEVNVGCVVRFFVLGMRFCKLRFPRIVTIYCWCEAKGAADLKSDGQTLNILLRQGGLVAHC